MQKEVYSFKGAGRMAQYFIRLMMQR